MVLARRTPKSLRVLTRARYQQDPHSLFREIRTVMSTLMPSVEASQSVRLFSPGHVRSLREKNSTELEEYPSPEIIRYYEIFVR